MLEAVVALVIIALILLFLRAGRQNTIVYRKRVAPPDRICSINDHPSAFGPPASSDYHAERETGAGYTMHEALAFEGGEFGGGGAGDSYDTGASDPAGSEVNSFGTCESDIVSNNSDFNSCDSGTNDSGSSDSYSDSSSDNSSFSND
ncbi:hypothetical protein SAMN05216327_102600 [Dyadobacter sp. SG02]|uniref:hypothetical protein n=1 Tax=Dyadobacter sp. SG02 TaxID=1855291 RepID=UPI0008C8387E|nr:hypothetical protein [Dyadobacter sp. SG02]SEI58616.1 hypothetical protein SAMN05216327_102600 [Dyadobacter sp. SG02]